MRREPRHFTTFWLVFLMVALTAPCGRAQLYSGSITGVISDPSGAVVPGAKVTLTDIGKQVAQAVSTDAAGRFLIRSLPPSTYKLTVEMQGFNTYVQDNIVLEVNQNLALDLALTLGAAAQTVEVQSAATALATQDAATGQELNRTLINDLPLLGRGVFDLALLAPGVHQREGGSGGANNFISNGSRNSTADILMDGVSATSFEQNSGILDPLYEPSVDSVQEFKIQQSNFSAEIGFSGATVINMVTRSGSNQFHGSAWEFLRNNVLTANNWFSNASDTPLPARRYNLFGGTVGGPIKKDKTFFFFNYEGLRDVNAGTYTAGVPSAAMRKGDFGELCAAGFDANGRCMGDGQLWDPYSGVYDENAGGAVRSLYIPFNRMDLYQSPGNPNLNGTSFQPAARPGNLIDPVALKMMQYFPLPNVNVGNSNYNPYNNWLSAGSNRSRNDQWDIKIDHNFNDSNRISAKFSRGLYSGTPANPFKNALDPTVEPGLSHTHLFALNYTRTFSAGTLLNLSYGFTRRYDDYTDPKVDATATLGMPDYIKTSGFVTAPAIQISNYYSATGYNNNIGAMAWGILRQSPETHQLVGGLSHLRGAHDLRIGGEIRMHRMNEVQPGEQSGYFAFDQNGTSQSPWVDGDAMASFLVGFPNWGEYEVPVFVSSQSYQIAGYIQDNWKWNKRLTLNVGLRYQIETPRTERYNRMSYVDPSAPSPLQVPGLPDLTGVLAFVNNKNRHNYGYDLNNWGPRFGFAYSLTDKTVMRGGYGIFYQITTRGASGNGAYGFQGFDRYTEMMTTYQWDGATPGARLYDPFPGGPLLPPGASLGGMSYVGEGIRGPIKGMDATPYEQTWTYGFQRQFPWDVLLEADYVGKKGTKLFFGGASELDHLGPQIETYSRAQIEDLITYVDNPLYGYVPDGTSLGSPTIQKFHLQLPYPQFTGVNGVAFPVANSIYHALQLRAEKRFAHGLQFLINYTWSKSIDDASITHDGLGWLGGTPSLQDPNNYRLERGLSQFDLPHLLNISYVYELPFGRGKMLGSTWNPVVNAILGGWKTNGIWTFSDGFPIGLYLAGGLALPTYGGQRPDLLGTLQRNTGANFRDQYFANPEVVVAPPDYAIGTAPRTIGSVRTPSTQNANLSLLKEFFMNKLREGAHLEYRAEFFNAFNHPKFCGPDTTLEGGSFGIVSCTANSPREVQMALKFYW